MLVTLILCPVRYELADFSRALRVRDGVDDVSPKLADFCRGVDGGGGDELAWAPDDRPSAVTIAFVSESEDVAELFDAELFSIA